MKKSNSGVEDFKVRIANKVLDMVTKLNLRELSDVHCQDLIKKALLGTKWLPETRAYLFRTVPNIVRAKLLQRHKARQKQASSCMDINGSPTATATFLGITLEELEEGARNHATQILSPVPAKDR